MTELPDLFRVAKAAGSPRAARDLRTPWGRRPAARPAARLSANACDVASNGAGACEKLSLVIADLRGYGSSSVPGATPDHFSYSKRAMAQDVCDIMDELGHERFLLCGQHRGGRVAYRLAPDAPARVLKLAVLDIVPTYEMWHRLTPGLAMKIFHWTFLAQPLPWPERMIGAILSAGSKTNRLLEWIGCGFRA